MKIVYMGTPDFAVPALEALVKDGHEVGYVVSQPDAAKDRGKKLKPTAVKAKALEYDLTVLQPEKIKGNEEFLETLRTYAPDLIVVAAYGRILPKEILDLPKYGCVNIHGSILPRWRGAAPIQWSVIAGDKETGVTLMYMAEGLDTGDMIAKAYTSTEGKTSGDLHDELSVLGAELLISKLKDFEAGTIEAEKQNEEESCYEPMLSKKDGIIDFNKGAEEIECAIRGLSPWPGAYTTYNGDTFKIWEAKVLDENKGVAPGTIYDVSKEGIKIATGKGTLMATVIQVPGKRRMNVEDYIKGNTIEINSTLG
ncbi:MAG: methionyl-tRNA formyltransferase [Eubacterium sp.]|nr:methionyl-tRNA formyltransferase [Eubacterium sp.]